MAGAGVEAGPAPGVVVGRVERHGRHRPPGDGVDEPDGRDDAAAGVDDERFLAAPHEPEIAAGIGIDVVLPESQEVAVKGLDGEPGLRNGLRVLNHPGRTPGRA